jgi:hypothetical protein
LLSELARRTDDERAGSAGGFRLETLAVAEQARCECEAERDRLAGAGLRRDKEVFVRSVFGEDSGLNRCRFGIGAGGEGSTQRRVGS